jgi:hypothetical protein
MPVRHVIKKGRVTHKKVRYPSTRRTTKRSSSKVSRRRTTR